MIIEVHTTNYYLRPAASRRGPTRIMSVKLVYRPGDGGTLWVPVWHWEYPE